MDDIVHGVTESRTQLSASRFHFSSVLHTVVCMLFHIWQYTCCFTYGSIHASMLLSPLISPSPPSQKDLFKNVN